MNDVQKKDLANILQIGWRRYTELFAEPPHGTQKQMQALVELMHADLCIWVAGVRNRPPFSDAQGTRRNWPS